MYTLRSSSQAFCTATQLAVNKIKEIAMTVKKQDKIEERKMLEKFAVTALSSKLISPSRRSSSPRWWLTL